MQEEQGENQNEKEFYGEEVAMKKHIEYDDFGEYVEVFIDGQLLVEGEPDLDYLYAVLEKI